MTLCKLSPEIIYAVPPEPTFYLPTLQVKALLPLSYFKGLYLYNETFRL